MFFVKQTYLLFTIVHANSAQVPFLYLCVEISLP